MNTVSTLLDDQWQERYRRISRLNIRSSIYDVTNRCNLRCRGCFFFSSDEDKAADEETDVGVWESFIEKEMERDVNLAILIGGEPTLCLDRVEPCYSRLPTFCATNGQIKVDRDRFPDMMVGISLWGDEEDEKLLRGRDSFGISSKHYAGDPYVYYLYTITPKQVGKVERMTRKIADVGLKVHYQLFSNDEGVEGMDWTEDLYREVRDRMDEMLERFPKVVVSSRYYHRVLTTQTMLGRRFDWMECPSVSEAVDDREPRPKRLAGFNSYGSDYTTIHRCCTSVDRDCETCHDGAATMSWIMVNKREHMQSPGDFANWVDVTHMFAKLYEFIPW